MGVLKKQGVYWIDDYVDGRRMRERINSDGWLAETVVGMCRTEIREYRQLEKRWTTQSILESTQSLHDSFLALR
jgi:hypothetical protein